MDQQDYLALGRAFEAVLAVQPETDACSTQGRPRPLSERRAAS
jgi:hypothetical protein